MKKIFILALVMGLLSHNTLAAGINIRFADDFENVTVTDGKAYINSKDEYALTTTNQGIEKVEIATVAGSKAIKFTGRTNAGSSTFTITLPQAYTEAAYPNTKLVIMYDETIETAVSNSYEHMVIRGTNQTAAGNVVQMFRFAPSADKFVSFRANNSGTAREGKENQPMTHTYVIDLANDKFDWYYDINKLTGASFMNSGVFDAVTDIKFRYLAKEVVSLDNIRIFIVPDDLVFEISGENVTDMSVKDDFTFNASNYLSNEALSGITVTKNGIAVDASAYKIIQTQAEEGINVTVDFAEDLDYETPYKITVPAGTSDVLGNVTAKAKTFEITTAEKIRFVSNVEWEETETSILFTVTARSESDEKGRAYIIAALYDADGIFKKCAYMAKDFEVGEQQTFKGGFAKEEGGTVKAVVLGTID